MVIAKGASGLSLTLAQAASRHAADAHAPGKTGLVLIVIALAVLGCLMYWVSLWLYPFTMCRRCGGSGQITGFLPWSRAFCYKCDGRGLVPRLGTKVTDLRGRYPR